MISFSKTTSSNNTTTQGNDRLIDAFPPEAEEWKKNEKYLELISTFI